jgi:hypothetical protein
MIPETGRVVSELNEAWGSDMFVGHPTSVKFEWGSLSASLVVIRDTGVQT